MSSPEAKPEQICRGANLYVHLPPVNEGYLLLQLGHLAFSVGRTPYPGATTIRVAEASTPTTDLLQLGGFRGINTMLPYSRLPRLTEPVDLAAGQKVTFGRESGIVVMDSYGRLEAQTNTLVDNAQRTALSVDSGISASHAKLEILKRGLVFFSDQSTYGTGVTVESGAPQYIPLPQPPVTR